jgi:hypothetical protein
MYKPLVVVFLLRECSERRNELFSIPDLMADVILHFCGKNVHQSMMLCFLEQMFYTPDAVNLKNKQQVY